MGEAHGGFVDGYGVQPRGAAVAPSILAAVHGLTGEPQLQAVPRPDVPPAACHAPTTASIASSSSRGRGEQVDDDDRRSEWWAKFKAGKAGAGAGSSTTAARLPFHPGTPMLEPFNDAVPVVHGAQWDVERAAHSQPSGPTLEATSTTGQQASRLPHRLQATLLPHRGVPLSLPDSAFRSSDTNPAPLSTNSWQFDDSSAAAFGAAQPRTPAALPVRGTHGDANQPPALMRLRDVPVVHGAQWDVEWAAQSEPAVLPSSAGPRHAPTWLHADPMAPHHRVHLELAPQHQPGDGRPRFQVQLTPQRNSALTSAPAANARPTYVPQQRRPGVSPVWPAASSRSSRTGLDSEADFMFT
jgi:hypothetical protein